jgi:cobalt-zinc-cadmium efflux system protein
MMNHDNSGINHRHVDGSKGLMIALLAAVAVIGVEIAGGLLSHSLALLSDAGHMLVDALALAMSLIALNLAKRPATEKRTYGFHRAEIMAALANGVALTLVAAYIFYEAYQRFHNAPTVNTPIMLGVAVIGLAANLNTVYLLHRARHNNLNVGAAFFHAFGDSMSSDNDSQNIEDAMRKHLRHPGASLRDLMDWLRQTQFDEVDCLWKDAQSAIIMSFKH